MIILCENNKALGLSKDFMNILISGDNKEEHVFDVEIGNSYVVYIIYIYENNIYYCIWTEDIGFSFFPGELFSIIDGRISSTWLVGNSYDSFENDSNDIVFGYREVVENHNHLRGLIERNIVDINIISSKKEFMDFEYPDKRIKDSAAILDGFWVECYFCSDAWECNSKLAIIKCTSCKKIMNNPFFTNKRGNVR